MANKRSLKRSITLFCEELFSEGVAASFYSHSHDNAEALLFCIVKMHDHFIRRISHPEPGMSAKRYYKNLREQFTIQASELIDQIKSL